MTADRAPSATLPGSASAAELADLHDFLQADGIELVVVNGRVALDEAGTGARAGAILRH